MQIKGLHKNIYKLSSYSLSQEKLELQRKKYEKPVSGWQKLKAEGVSDETCQAILGISRATYYRYKGHLDGLTKGILPPSKKPKNMRKPQWGESETRKPNLWKRKNSYYPES